jgi:hypothetical protein
MHYPELQVEVRKMGPVLPRFSLRELPKPILTSTVVSNFSLACPLDNRLQFNAASDYFQQKLLSITEESACGEDRRSAIRSI